MSQNNKSIIEQNREAWDKKVENGWIWTVPVSESTVAKARQGDLDITLAINPIPKEWIPCDLEGKNVLCLASGGGQQGPLFAAAGAKVTVLDLSEKQLEQDRLVAEREGLELELVQGNMCELDMFAQESFDIVFCPVSITYIPDVKPMFQEVYRVLKRGGEFLFGAPNPFIYLFDGQKWEENIFEVANTLPFNSLDELDEIQQKIFLEDKQPIEYSHTLQDLIGAQLETGFLLKAFREERDKQELSNYTATYFTTCAIKL